MDNKWEEDYLECLNLYEKPEGIKFTKEVKRNSTKIIVDERRYGIARTDTFR